MAGNRVSEDAAWLEAQLGAAPPALRDRARAYAGETSGPLPERLARAARQALAAVLARPGDRSVALDLLAADALVTLALKAQASRDPAGLARFAGALLDD
jgi:hypothetical protein